MIRINTAKSPGLVFHFTRTLGSLDSIIENGLRYSSQKEPSTQRSKRFKEAPESYFISTTRSPAAIYQAKGSWNYGLILDNRVLTDNQFESEYFYNLAPHPVTIVVDQVGKDWFYFVSSDMTDIKHRLTDKEADEFIDFFYDITDRDGRFSGDEERGEYALTFNLAEVDQKDLPGVIHRMLRVSGNEAEQRLHFPKAKERGAIDIRKAILGVLVPDTKYYSESAEKFREKYPNIKMYVYRDPDVPSSSPTYQKLKKEHPDLKSLYRLPTV